jgi:hypothetical protein
MDREALAAIVRGDLDAAARVARTPAFDADRFVSFAAEHQLAGFVHAAIAGTPMLAALPAAARERLTGAFLRQWATNERLAQELREVTRTFQDAGCPFVLLKGLHLAIAYHGGADRRGMSDLDILVRKDDLARAVSLLVGRGYERSAGALLGWRIASTFTHACELQRNGIPLDLHWALVAHPSFRLDYEEIWARRRRFDADGADVHVLDDEHALTFQVLAIAKDLELGTVTLKAFADLYAIARAFDAQQAWEPFFAAREREHTARTAAAMLALMLSIFDATGEFRTLDGCLERSAGPPAPPALVERIAMRRRSLGDRVWAVGLYETSLLRAGAWWALSLPFRVAAHGMGHGPRASVAPLGDAR